MNGNYILDEDGNPVICRNILSWSAWIEAHERSVARTDIGTKTVSTVFLGIDHDFGSGGKPVLWETLIFNDDGSCEDYCERYTSRADAEEGHRRAVAMLLPKRSRTPEQYDIAEIIPFDSEFKH